MPRSSHWGKKKPIKRVKGEEQLPLPPVGDVWPTYGDWSHGDPSGPYCAFQDQGSQLWCTFGCCNDTTAANQQYACGSGPYDNISCWMTSCHAICDQYNWGWTMPDPPDVDWSCFPSDPEDVTNGNNICYCECYRTDNHSSNNCPNQGSGNVQQEPECYRWSSIPCTIASMDWVCNAEGLCQSGFSCSQICDIYSGCSVIGNPEGMVFSYNGHWQCGQCSGSCVDCSGCDGCTSAPFSPGSCGWNTNGC